MIDRRTKTLAKICTVLMLLFIITSCAGRTIVQGPDGITIVDRMVSILDSDLSDESKVDLATALLEREDQEAQNWLNAFREYLGWAMAGVSILK